MDSVTLHHVWIDIKRACFTLIHCGELWFCFSFCKTWVCLEKTLHVDVQEVQRFDTMEKMSLLSCTRRTLYCPTCYAFLGSRSVNWHFLQAWPADAEVGEDQWTTAEAAGGAVVPKLGIQARNFTLLLNKSQKRCFLGQVMRRSKWVRRQMTAWSFATLNSCYAATSRQKAGKNFLIKAKNKRRSSKGWREMG